MFRAAATALLLSVLCCTPAIAADRDRDRMPDSWEKRHHVKKARGDADRDGLRNRAEYRFKTDPRRRDSDRDGLRDGDEIRFGWHPRKRDSDGDGIRDGKENAGVVTAVSGLRVTIRLARGGRLRGLLEDPKALACVAAVDATAPGDAGEAGAAQDGTGDAGAPEDDFVWDPAWGEEPDDLDVDETDEDSPLARAAQADEDPVYDEEDETEAEDAALDAAEGPVSESCRAALRTGALVHQATSELGLNGRRLTRLHLVAAS
jgi:hypothetical protein